MSEEGPGDAAVDELGDGDFTLLEVISDSFGREQWFGTYSISSAWLVIDVLGSDFEAGLELLTSKEEVECRWCDNDLCRKEGYLLANASETIRQILLLGICLISIDLCLIIVVADEMEGYPSMDPPPSQRIDLSHTSLLIQLSLIQRTDNLLNGIHRAIPTSNISSSQPNQKTSHWKAGQEGRTS